MKRKKILLIDEDQNDIEIIKQLIRKLNIKFELHIVNSGNDALSILNDERNWVKPDLVILDIATHKTEGLEFLRIIHNYYSLKDIKIFVLLSSAQEFEKIVAENLGINGFILKPIDPGSPAIENILRLNGDTYNLN
jgi:CheY-like chemotaxis protein